jgi:hypothetical protein
VAQHLYDLSIPEEIAKLEEKEENSCKNGRDYY